MSGLRISLQDRLGDFTLDAAFEAPASGCTCLLGPSGSGKTSILRAVAGLQAPRAGRIEINGAAWFDSVAGASVPAHKRAVGYVFQDANLFPHLDVRGNLEYGFQRSPAAGRKIEFEEALRLFGLTALLHRSAGALSGGEKQRVAMARAVLSGPEILLMDEPLAALDAPARRDLLGVLVALRRRLDVPVLYVTHAWEEAARLANHVIQIESGKVVNAGPFAEMTSLFSALSAAEDAPSTVAEAHVEGHDAAYHLTEIRSPWGRMRASGLRGSPGDALRIRIDSRDVSLALQAEPGSSILNEFELRVAAGRDLGEGRMLVTLDGGSAPLLALITLKSWDALNLAEGRRVFARIKGVRLLE